MKARYWFLSGVPLGILINHLLVDFYKFTANVALKLRPELSNLSFWEAFWSGHFHNWIWLVNPQTAYIVMGVACIWLGAIIMLYIGMIVE